MYTKSQQNVINNTRWLAVLIFIFTIPIMAQEAPAEAPANTPDTETLLRQQSEMAAEIDAIKTQMTEVVPTLTEAQKKNKQTLISQKSTLETKLSELNNAIEGGLDPALVEASITNLKTEIDALDSQINAIVPGADNAELKAQIDALAASIEQMQTQLKTNQNADAELKAQVEAKADKNRLLQGPDGVYLKVAGLLQFWGTTTQDATTNEGWDTEFYIRRMRLMFYGQVTDYINYFVETDNPRLGKDGNWDSTTFIQDAYVEFNLHKAFQLDIGMLLPNFSHHGFQSATSLVSLEYHGAMFKYPAGSSKVWRDSGVMIRGLFAKDRLDYRLGLFNGVRGNASDPRNPDDLPRVSGRLTFNIFEAEGGPGVAGMFYDGIYIKKTDAGIVSTKKVLSLGASFDWQPDLNVTMKDTGNVDDAGLAIYEAGTLTDYFALAGDLFADIPIGEQKLMSLNGQLGIYYYDFGDRSNAMSRYNFVGDGSAYSGWGMMGELGFRYNAIQPLILFDVYNANKTAVSHEGDYKAVYGGLNYYLLGNGVTFKLQIGSAKKADGPWSGSGIFQTQLVF